MNKPPCYKAPCQWSADSCCNCQYDMECYRKFLDYMAYRAIYEMEEEEGSKLWHL